MGGGPANAPEVGGREWDQAHDAGGELHYAGAAQVGFVGDLMQRTAQAVKGMGRIGDLDHRCCDDPASIVGSLL